MKTKKDWLKTIDNYERRFVFNFDNHEKKSKIKNDVKEFEL